MQLDAYRSHKVPPFPSPSSPLYVKNADKKGLPNSSPQRGKNINPNANPNVKKGVLRLDLAGHFVLHQN